MSGPQHDDDVDDNNNNESGVEMTVPNTDNSGGGEVYTVEAATGTARNAIHRFFYPNKQQQTNNPQQPSSEDGERQLPEQRVDDATTDIAPLQQEEQDSDTAFVHHFWTAYDDILILSIFTQVGILFRLASSTWFTFFDGVFSTDSPLFVNLPLNCLSCFIMGVLCSGERLMEIICTRFTPPRTQQTIVRDSDTDDIDDDYDNDVLILEDGRPSLQRRGRGRRLPALRRRPRRESSEPHGEYHYGRSPSSDDDYPLSSPSNSRVSIGLRRRRKKREKHSSYFRSWQPPVHLNEDLRDVQLLALERRIRMSKCLVLFPVKKEDVDVMEHYFHEGYKKRDDDDDEMRRAMLRDGDFDDLELAVEDDDDDDDHNEATRAANDVTRREPVTPLAHNEKHAVPTASALSPPRSIAAQHEDEDHVVGAGTEEKDRDLQESPQQLDGETTNGSSSPANSTSNKDKDDNHHAEDGAAEEPDYIADLTTNVQENVDRLRRVNLADGWDSGTTPEAMSDDLMLGLRDGFCGALSSFSSWNSSMITLMRQGQIGEAFVGYMLGLQLPIIAYRFGQHVAVYIFIWRTRRETRGDERRGYGIRVAVDDEESVSDNDGNNLENGGGEDEKREESEVPSVRAVVTAIFIMALVTQCTSLSFFRDPANQQTALSLLFSPLGVLARWRLSKCNRWRPNFPIGTFTANLLACALSGSLGSLLAGNPGPRERIVLVSVVAGFGGTLSSLANFVVEILAGVDPILFRFDGIIYAVVSVCCAMVIGFIFSASVEWADETRTAAEIMGDDAP